LTIDHLFFQVKFPRGKFTYKAVDVAGSGDLSPGLAKSKKMSRVQVDLQPDAEITVCGFGIPFANPGHPVDAWINDNAPIVGDLSLASFLVQRTFDLLCQEYASVMVKMLEGSTLPPPFSYPYGSDHTWNLEKYGNLIRDNMVRFAIRFIISSSISFVPG